MSYLGLPRLTFAGRFRANVNTINNDVRHYDPATFEPRFQTRRKGQSDVYEGWWNPEGSNAFVLYDCAVSGLVGADGTPAAGATALRVRVESQVGHTSAKLVDLDPQFQFASAIWGLRLSFTIGDEVVMSAAFQPGPFRDVFFGRVAGVGGSPGASARFTARLQDIVFGDGPSAASLAGPLRAAAGDARCLSMSLLLYGYDRTPGEDSFTTGAVVASIGPWAPAEPEMFAPGRRFAPSASSPNLPFASASGLGYLNAAESPDGGVLSVDFGNALPMKPGAAPDTPPVLQDLGPLQVVVLTAADTVTSGPGGLTLQAASADGDVLGPAQYETIGTVQGYDSTWLAATGGIVDLPIPAAARELIGDHPLAILTAATGGQAIAIRETVAGLWVRADEFVQRLDAAPSGWVDTTVSLYCMRYGAPYPQAPIAVSLQPRQDGTGGTGDPSEKMAPQAAIPPINVPAEAICLPTQPMTAGADGILRLNYRAGDPGAVRPYVDGQIYVLVYQFQATGQSPMPMVENIATHVRSAFTPPAAPGWETDVAPVLAQYGNLYPVMSRGLFSFSDYDTVVAHARLLRLAMTRPIEDPNYMPATRDLSAGRQRMIVDWLSGYLPGEPADGSALPPLPEGVELDDCEAPPRTPPGHATAVSAATLERASAVLGPGDDGKGGAIRSYLRTAAAPDGGEGGEG